MEFSNITEILKEITAYINTVVGGNEFAAGAIIAGLMGVGTYLARDIPTRIWGQLKKHTTTSLELNSTNNSYHLLSKYLQLKGFTNQSRFIKVGNGRYGEETSVKQIGHGTQVFWVNWRSPILITSAREDSQSSQVKEFITLKKFGRSHDLFDEILKVIDKEGTDPSVTKFYSYNDSYQYLITTQVKKRMDTIALPLVDVTKLKNTIDTFFKKEEWYKKHQIPYQLGILLYGPPGTGKTSLIRAIAGYMNKGICFVENESALIGAAQQVNDSIIVVEEADTLAMESREKEDDSEDGNILKLFDKLDKAALGKILNALDGIISNHGRTIIMTTNHPSALDKALLRPGRIDLQLEIGFLTSETFNIMLKRFFPEYKECDVELLIDLSPVIVQNDVIEGLTADEIVKKYTKTKIKVA